MPDSSPHTPLTSALQIALNGDYALKFFDVLQSVADANDSLLASVSNFADVDYFGQQIHPRIAVEGYARFMRERLEIAFDMLTNDDSQTENRRTNVSREREAS